MVNFGISPAPEEFQLRLNEAIEGLMESGQTSLRLVLETQRVHP